MDVTVMDSAQRYGEFVAQLWPPVLGFPTNVVAQIPSHTTLFCLSTADFVPGKSELRQHLVGLLTELRRPGHHLARRARERDRPADRTDPMALAVLLSREQSNPASYFSCERDAVANGIVYSSNPLCFRH
jgi:hypothetical protein